MSNGNNKNTLIVKNTEPSTGSESLLNSEGRKPLYRDTVAGLVQGEGTNASVDKQDCVFKRGGMCMMHGVMGLKYKETTQEWTKKKNGIF